MRPALIEQVLGVAPLGTVSLVGSSVLVDKGRCMRLFDFNVTYGGVIVLSGDILGTCFVTISKSSDTYKAYGSTSGCKLYHVGTTIYIVVPNGHLLYPVVIGHCVPHMDIVTLPSSAAEITVT